MHRLVGRPLGLGALSLASAMALSGCSRPGSSPAPAPASAVEGIDLSDWQGGAIDFGPVKASGKAFVFIKATQGGTVVDPDHARHASAARAAGLAVGSYHFYVVGDTPAAQFGNFSAQVAPRPGDLPPVVDIEALGGESAADAAAPLHQFLGLLQQRYGVRPIVYSGEAFANQNLPGFSAYPLWLAEYSSHPAPQLPLDWTQWAFWQYSQSGAVAGVDGPVDLSRFNGTDEDLQALRMR